MRWRIVYCALSVQYVMLVDVADAAKREHNARRAHARVIARVRKYLNIRYLVFVVLCPVAGNWHVFRQAKILATDRSCHLNPRGVRLCAPEVEFCYSFRSGDALRHHDT